jgi:STE24 endopeptidase
VANEDKASRYHRLRRRASVLSVAISAAFLALLLLTGFSVAIRDTASYLASGSPAATVLLYVVIAGVTHELLQLPLAFYLGVTLERRYGLSTQPLGAWWKDQGKAGALSLGFAAAGALAVWWLIRWSPDSWWLAATAFSALVLVGLAQLAPLVLLPIFYELKPLERASLVERLAGLAERSGTRVAGVFEWRLSDRTRKANAAFAGLGRTRRILLSDTLLAEYSDEEMEVILAHELSHQVHRDIWSAIALETGLLAVAFYAADRALGASHIWLGLAGKSDAAGLPLVVLCAAAVSLVLMPLVNAVSRAHERRADRYALEMTRNAPAFVSAMKRLASQNLAEERPARWVEVLFHSHPPTASRVEAARIWAASARAQRPTT